MSRDAGGRNEAHRLVVRGAFATGAGFLVKLGARLGLLLIAGRLFGAAAFGAYSIGVAAVESGVGLAGLSLKKVIFQFLDANAASGERPATHVVADAAVLVLTASGTLALTVMTVTATIKGRIPVEGAASRAVLARADDRGADDGRRDARRQPLAPCDPLRSGRTQHRRAVYPACRGGGPAGGRGYRAGR